MKNEAEFRARVEDIKRRIPDAFAEDPCYFFESAEECKFYKKNILNKETTSSTPIKGKYKPEVLAEINRVRKELGLNPLENE